MENQGLYFRGFTVDLHGNIEFPILGKINVLGHTPNEIKIKIREALFEKYLKDVPQAFVSLKLAVLLYTVIVEVGGTGVLTLYQDCLIIIVILANTDNIANI